CNLSNLTTGDLNLLHCKSSFEYSGVGFPSLYSVFYLRLQSLDFLQKLWIILQCLTKSFRINASGSLYTRFSLNIVILNSNFLDRVVGKFRSVIILSLGRNILDLLGLLLEKLLLFLELSHLHVVLLLRLWVLLDQFLDLLLWENTHDDIHCLRRIVQHLPKQCRIWLGVLKRLPDRIALKKLLRVWGLHTVCETEEHLKRLKRVGHRRGFTNILEDGRD